MNGFLNKARAFFARIFAGRYGADPLGLAMCYASIAIILIGALTGWGVLTILAYALFLWSVVRMFSKNTVARAKENQWFLAKTKPITTYARQSAVRFKNRKQFRYFRCPKCRAMLKLPRGVGNANVTCGKCGEKFTRKA